MSVYISKVYTKTGDRGQTALVGGKMVDKDSTRIEAYGTVDELNAIVGVVRKANLDEAGPQSCITRIDTLLQRVQSELFNLGSQLATLPEDLAPTQPRIETRHIEYLENQIDDLNAQLQPLRSFTIPGGGWVSSHLHVARTVCRRAERRVATLGHETDIGESLRYLNRLSDTLYVLGRWNVAARGETEPLWTPEKT